ncbi:MMPL family transporter [Streptomyces sp. L7]
MDKIADLPGVASVVSPYDGHGHRPDQRRRADRPTPPSPSRTRPRTSTSPRRRRCVRAREGRRRPTRLQVGGWAAAPSGSPSRRAGTPPEIVGVGRRRPSCCSSPSGSLAASLLPIGTALLSVGTAYAAIVLLGHAMTVADFAPMLGMLVGLGVGIDYALFIVTRHRRGLKRGLSVTEAVTNAVATTGRAVVFAGATVCIALLGMLILRLGFLNGVAVAASLTVMLTCCGLRDPAPGPAVLHRPQGPQPPRTAPAGRARPPAGAAPTGLAARWSAFVERHPKLLGALRPGRHHRPRPADGSRSTWAPPTRATTRRRRPPARPTTSSRTASGPASTAPSPSSRRSTEPRTNSPSTTSTPPSAPPRASPP